jgi:diguanylate cyclase (GGDEF)-like protein
MRQIAFGIVFLVAFGAIFIIDTYKDKQLNKLVDVATYFQDPSRHLLKSTYLFDEALSNINKYNYTKEKIYLFKAKALLLASKGFIHKNCYLQYKNIEDVNKMIDDLVYKIENSKEISNTAELMQHHHYIMEKVSFDQWKKSITFFQIYQDDTIKFYNVAYIVLLIVLGFMFFLIAFIYQMQEKRKIKLISETDHLTGAFNRRRFYQEIKNYDGLYSIIMFDIDYFKKINDTYGHEKGDFVLKELVECIKNYIRQDDMIFRWGGEEFFILFKNTGLSQAEIIAEKIRTNIEKDDFDGVNITLSLSVIENRDLNIEEVIKKLDKGLYQAKENGRNQTIIIST